MIHRMIVPLLLVAVLAAGTAGGATRPAKQKQITAAAVTTKAPEPVPVNILSIIPAQGEPNTTVTLSGSGFTAGTTAYLGNTEIPARVVATDVLSFEIPRLQPGLYALFVKRGDGITSRTYNFSVLPPKPVVESMYPETVDMCSPGGERSVTITGRNFQAESRVLFNGAVVKSSFGSSQTLSFTVPPVQAGLHQIQVKNAEDTVTTPVTLVVRGTPEIFGVVRGESSVNYYNLVIEGRNFQPGATLSIEESGLQLGLNAGGGKRLRAGATGERDMLIYVDCSRLVYQRYPVDPTDKDLRLQVINPGGETSSVVQVSAP
ncbi:IPT/TIG domain-containing protein [Geobacter anodireducens]